MNRHSTWLARSAAVAVAAMATACGPSAAATSSADHAPPGQTRTVPASRPIPNVCDSKIVAPGDLADVLSGPITAKTLAGDPQTCEFSANDYSSISITVRPGLGDVTVSEWTGGKMPTDAGTVTGIGDRAAWQSTLKELIATKHNVLCDIGSQGTKASQADLQKKFGQLCEKIWAAP